MAGALIALTVLHVTVSLATLDSFAQQARSRDRFLKTCLSMAHCFTQNSMSARAIRVCTEIVLIFSIHSLALVILDSQDAYVLQASNYAVNKKRRKF